MNKLIAPLLLLSAAASVALAATPAAPPAAAPPAAAPAREAQLRLVGPTVWAQPDPVGMTKLRLTLVITAPAQSAMSFDPESVISVHLKDAAGKEPAGRVEGMQKGDRRPRVLQIGPGKTATLEMLVILRPANEKGKLHLSLEEAPGKWLECDGLEPGKYTLTVGLEQQPTAGGGDQTKDAPLWTGKMVSNALVLEITDQFAVESKAAGQDGLEVATLLPRKTWEEGQPLEFTLRFKNLTKKPFMLNDADVAGSWQVHFADLGRKGSWKLHQAAAPEQRQWPAVAVQPGGALNVSVVLDRRAGPLSYEWQFPPDVRGSLDTGRTTQLPPGKYQLTVDVKMNKGRAGYAFRDWTGAVATEAADFEVTSKPTTQPATQPATQRADPTAAAVP